MPPLRSSLLPRFSRRFARLPWEDPSGDNIDTPNITGLAGALGAMFRSLWVIFGDQGSNLVDPLARRLDIPALFRRQLSDHSRAAYSTLQPFLANEVLSSGVAQMDDAFDALMIGRSSSDRLDALATLSIQAEGSAYRRTLAGFDIPPRAGAYAGPNNPPTPPIMPGLGRPVPVPGPGSSLSFAQRFDLVNPHAVDYAQRMAINLAGRVTSGQISTIREIVAGGIRLGIPVEDTARMIYQTVGLHPRWAMAVSRYRQGLIKQGSDREWADGQSARYAGRLRGKRAMAISRTETMAASNQGKLAAWDAHGSAGLFVDGEMTKEWLTGPKVAQGQKVNQKVTGPCHLCAPMDGVKVTGVRGEFEMPNSRRVATPPAHPHCFPAGTMISGHRVVAAAARWMEGEVVTVRFRSGQEFTSTPNHPILTGRGWVEAGLLHEADDLIGPGSAQWVPAVHPQDQQMPARIEDVARALQVTLGMTPIAVPVAAEDFHGDGGQSEVAVVWADGLLGDRDQAALGHHLAHLAFEGRDPEDSPLAGLGEGFAMGYGLPLAAHRIMSGGRVGGVLLGAAVGHHESVGLGVVSDADPGFDQSATDDGSAHLVAPGQAVLALAGQVATDHVVDIERAPFHGWVWNVETITGCYNVSGVLVSNCRCTVILHPPEPPAGPSDGSGMEILVDWRSDPTEFD